MKYYLIISALFLLLVGCSKKNSNPVEPTPTPNFITFTKTFGGINDDYGSSVQQISDGGFIIAGETSSFGAGGRDVYIIKTDSTGNIIWDKSFGGNGNDGSKAIQQTPDGGFVIAGFTASFSNGSYDVYLIKTDRSGTIVWEKTFGGSGDDWCNSVQQTLDGGFVMAGRTGSFGAGLVDVYLIKTDGSGNKVWEKTFGGSSYDYGYSVQQTSDGGFLIVGNTYSLGDGSLEVYLIKTDVSGNKVWEKNFGGSSFDFGYSVEKTSDGGFVIIGFTTSFGAGQEDVYLVKVDAEGNKIWEKTFGGFLEDQGNSIQQTSDGGFIISGFTESLGAGYFDVYLIKTDANGKKIWEKTFGGSSFDWGYSVQQVSDGGFVITGKTFSSGAGGSDVYLIKTDSEGNVK